MTNKDEKYLRIALRVTSDTSKFLLKQFGSLKKMEHKKGAHYSIKEDIDANGFYERKLKKLSPEIGLYTEEGERDLSKELVWVVDPIEGTSNYRVGNPFWATQICLLRNKKPVVAVVYAPVLKQRFTAVVNKGSLLNGKTVRVSGVRDMKLALISIGKGTGDENLNWYGKVIPKVMKHVRTFRNFGSTGLELAYVSAGMVDGHINSGSNIYDYAPGALLVREAGGVVTDFEGNDWAIGKRELIASNKTLNVKIIKIL